MPKAPKLPNPLEKVVQASCVRILEAHGCRVFRRNVGVMPLEHNGRKRVFRSGSPGEADLYGWLPDGRHFELEIKRRGQRPRPEQIRFLRDANRSVAAFWVDSADELMLVLPALLAGARIEYLGDDNAVNPSPFYDLA